MNLTKSEYLLFLKHPAWLWLKKRAAYKLPPVDANTQSVFDTGNRLEAYAERLFPDGRHLGFNSYDEYQTLSSRTQEAIMAGHSVLFQARFDADSLTCITDIVEFTAPKTIRLYEVKSSTTVKEEHVCDLAFQVLVIQKCHYEVESVSVIHVNNKYVRGGDIDPSGLLATEEITDKVRAQRDVTSSCIDQALAVVALPKMPSISPRHCGPGSLPVWLPIFRSLSDIPEPSIYDLPRLNATLIGELEDCGILLMKDIPDSVRLSEQQQILVRAVKEGGHVIDRGRIREFLKTLTYPLYFFDYETCMDAVPPYEGTKPYQQIPTQYSLHILDSPDGNLRHSEYIHRTPDHPAGSLAEALRKDIGETGSVIVWSATFEMNRNREMAAMLPEHAEFFHAINDRVVDLMVPFSNGMYVDPRFLGSASIKNVLPVLVPELSYKNLNVQEGQTAQRLWMQAVLEGKGTDQEREQLFQDLLTYCEMDTMAMVKIHEKLRATVIGDENP